MISMAHDIFISYANEDKPAADSLCANLEQEGIQCWIAPRNISPGEKYATAIIHAIENAKIVVLVFSRNSDQSVHVRTEIERAFNQGKTIIPVRIENIEPSDEMQYFIGSRQLFDAFSGSEEEHARLAWIIRNRLTPDSQAQGSQEYPAQKNSQINEGSEQTEDSFTKIGSRKNRFIAYSADLGLGLIFGFVLLLVIALIIQGSIGTDAWNNLMFLEDKKTQSPFYNTLIGFLLSLGLIFFLIIFDISGSLKSPGKRWRSLKIVKYSGASESRTWKLTRSLTKNIPIILIMTGFTISEPTSTLGNNVLYIGIFILILWGIVLCLTPKSQSVHDLVAGTVVISAKK
jgi:uncharacterized RDD family membrane protein YckC